MPKTAKRQKQYIKLNKKTTVRILIAVFLVFGVAPWFYYFMAGESHPWYPIKLSMWTPIDEVPADFVPPEEVYIKNVSYFYIPVEKFLEIRYSGVPATAVVANFYGDNVSLEEVNKELSSAQWGPPLLSGGGTGNMVAFFTKRGYKAKSYGGSERDLKYHLSLGHPVIIWQFRNPTFIIKETNSIEQGGHSMHTRVVIGYKKINGQEYFIVHEGGMGTLLDMASEGPAPKVPAFGGNISESQLQAHDKYVKEQERLKSTLPDYVETNVSVLEGRNHFIKKEDFLAMWQNFIMNPFGLPFTASPTPFKPNWTIMAYKER